MYFNAFLENLFLKMVKEPMYKYICRHVLAHFFEFYKIYYNLEKPFKCINTCMNMCTAYLYRLMINDIHLDT